MSDFRYEVAAVKAPTGLVIPGRRYFDRIVDSLPDGQECTLTLEPKKDKKTRKQLGGLFGPMYSSIIEFLLTDQGYRRDEWPKRKELIHEGLCAEYQGFVTCPITKKDVRKFRLSSATKQETSDYMNWLGQYMAEEHHFVVQMPGDNR